MEILDLTLDQITPYSNNPRNNASAISAVAASIREFGFRVPLVLDPDHVIITGHTRFEAAKRLGLQTAPCLIARDLTPEQVRAYRLADNKVAELAEWDAGRLSQELKALNEIGVDMGEFGFEELEDLDPGAVIEDTPPEDAEPITRPGDLFQLGRHRLLCGDSTDSDAVQRLMAGTKADLLLTDPPYNVDYTGKTKASLKIDNDNMSATDFRRFLVSAFSTADGALRPGAACYIWHASSESVNFYAAVAAAGWTNRQQLVWVKTSLMLGHSDYQWRHEPCIYATKNGGRHYFTDHRNEATVVEDRPNLTGMSKQELTALCKALLDREPVETTVLRADKPIASEQHPTMKPVKLFARLVSNSTPRGARVLDLFAGSGTTAMACEQLDRSAYMMELSPTYCDRIIKRWEQATGEQAVRL